MSSVSDYSGSPSAAPELSRPSGRGYSTQYHIKPRLDRWLSHISIYALLTIIGGLAYFLVVYGLSLVVNETVSPDNPILMGVLIAVLMAFLFPLRSHLQNRIDRLLFKSRNAARERLEDFQQRVTHAVDVSEIATQLRSQIRDALHPDQLHIFIHDPFSEHYVAARDEHASPTTDMRFAAKNPVAITLVRRQEPLLLTNAQSYPQTLKSEQARLTILDVCLLAPLLHQNKLLGWVALGPRSTGLTYSSDDINFLKSIGEQAAVAIERAQVVANLEQRVREMDVLSRVAQGINITITFDDILELVYAQTTQLISATDFRIALTNQNTGNLYYAFYLEKNERLDERERHSFLSSENLEAEVVRTRQSLLTDEYERECRARGIIPETSGLYSWMGVPLNAGADTIGVISLAHREPEVIYTADQRNLLQAISDQAAGAIIKTHLLEETERYANQLETLHKIGQSLSSTLETSPLLHQILDSAAEILNCEAGSLFLIDEQTGELVFEVAVGPVATHLIGQRLSPGTGLVGKSVETRSPIIANQVQRKEGWSESTDKETGFVTRDMLVVPILVKDHVIGVIEVINKKDGQPFANSDQQLLITFTSQAGIAIENARLYTQTDEALSDRVEEMSVMQRIDRELNASLDLERTMKITLSWSLRHSRSLAGLIGLVEADEEEGLKFLNAMIVGTPAGTKKVSASDDESLDNALVLDSPAIRKSIEEGMVQVDYLFGQNGSEQTSFSPCGLLDHTISQVILPIKRQNETIGVIVLENQEESFYSKEIVTFLSRLCDHAAIAIHNAQLYAEIQKANVAKSDFISLVSHELKTPMTSIRGYADLLSQGAVGEINEDQANFLHTIRSNVNRMSTLVSDLADVSRIESGRMRLEYSAVSLHEALGEVLRSAQGQFEEKQQILNTDIPDDLPFLWADYNRIIQILANLVSNANKYTPKNGIIRLEARRTDNPWDPMGAPEVVHIQVQDSGFGISEQDQRHIFDKFFRSEDEYIREVPGTGLGLNITRHLVEMQGGQIWFESQPGHGATFHFTVPVAVTN
jgi:K+-sensing histidine kinase KdpD